MAKTANNKKGDAGKARQPPIQEGRGEARRRQACAHAVAAEAAGQGQVRQAGEKRGFGKFLRDVRVEMGKVTWPTRKDLAQSTLVVLVAVAIAAVYTLALDTVFDKAVAFVVNLLT